MKNFKSLITQLNTFNFNSNHFMFVGGACLAVYNLRDTEDLDLICSKILWDELQFKYPIVKTSNFTKIKITPKIEVLGLGSAYLPNGYNTFNQLILKAENIDGLNYAPLDFVKSVKINMSRPKDLIDIELIDEYLGSHTVL